MKTQYTAKEAAAIKLAYSALDNAADQVGSASIKLDRALRHERRERDCLLTAKALLVECAYVDKGANALQLYSMAEGCAAAAMVGAELARCNYDGWRRFCGCACAAISAHEAATHRTLDLILAPHNEKAA